MKPKSAAEMAREWVRESAECEVMDTWDAHENTWLAGHAAGIAQAGELVALVELECEHQLCVCKVNPYVGGLVPCETCRLRAALARFKALAGDVK